MLSMLDGGHHLAFGCAVATELIGDHDARRPALPLQQLAEQALGGAPITPALDQHVEDHPGLVHGAPEPVFNPGDLDHDLIQMPLVSGRRRLTADLIGEVLAKLERPLHTLSWLTMMPRAASISSTMRRLGGKRKYSHTAWLMTSAGKR
jgi:hypothetical protein